jgi:hypothetical protein
MVWLKGLCFEPVGYWMRLPGLVLGLLLAACGARTELESGSSADADTSAGAPTAQTGGRSGSGGSVTTGATGGTSTGGTSTKATGGSIARGGTGGASGGTPATGGSATDGGTAGKPWSTGGWPMTGGTAGHTSGGSGGVAPEAGSAGEPSNIAGGGSAGEPSNIAGAGASPEAGTAGQPDTETLSIEPDTLADARLKKTYSATLSATGGSGHGYRFEISAGALPTGVTLNEDGTLAGIPEQLGDFQFTVAVVDSAGAEGSLELTLHVTRGRWLAIQTFLGSASSQELMVMQDMLDPSAPLVTIDDWIAPHGWGFSPDGSRFSYIHWQDTTTGDLLVLDMSGDELGEPVFLGEVPSVGDCSWSPDSTRIVCSDYGSSERHVVYFDLAQSNPAPVELLAQTGSGIAWVGDSTFAYNDVDGELMLVDASLADTAPVATGLVGRLYQVSSQYDRALVVLVEEGAVTGWTLLDLKTLEHFTFPGQDDVQSSPSFQSAVAATYGPSATDPAKYTYYTLGSTGVSNVTVRATREALPTNLEYSTKWLTGQYAAERYLELRDGIPSLTTIHTNGIETSQCPGELPEISSLSFSPDGNWIAFSSIEEPSSYPSVYSWWVAQVVDGVIQPPTQLEPPIVGANLQFSPDSSKLVVTGYDPYADSLDPVPIVLYDLSNPSSIEQYTLDLPYSWAGSGWSNDSSYVAFIGGAEAQSARPLYVVDALAPEQEPRLIITANTNPAPAPGCPMAFAFQP